MGGWDSNLAQRAPEGEGRSNVGCPFAVRIAQEEWKQPLIRLHTGLRMRVIRLLAALLLVAPVLACSSDTPTDPGPSGTLRLQPSSPSISVQPGGAASLTVSILRDGDFTGAATLDIEGTPIGVSIDLDTSTVTGSTAVLALEAGRDAPVGSHPVTIRARGAGVDDAVAIFSLVIEEPTPALLLFDTFTASGYFGGDTRPCCTPRNAAVAQEVLVEQDMWIDRFSFYFTDRFAIYGEAGAVPVTLQLHIRDQAGAVLDSATVDLPDTFAGDWVTWADLDFAADAGTTLIFSTFVVGGYDTNPAWSNYAADSSAGYTPGRSFIKQRRADEDLAEWSGYAPHIWDANFRVEGVVRPD